MVVVVVWWWCGGGGGGGGGGVSNLTFRQYKTIMYLKMFEGLFKVLQVRSGRIDWAEILPFLRNDCDSSTFDHHAVIF